MLERDDDADGEALEGSLAVRGPRFVSGISSETERGFCKGKSESRFLLRVWARS